MSEVTTTITDGVGIQTFISKEKIIHSMKHQKKRIKQICQREDFLSEKTFRDLGSGFYVL